MDNGLPRFELGKVADYRITVGDVFAIFFAATLNHPIAQ
ncbi:Uncharacterised protein [Vibrio cholerae]|nr:Uncharacterised protein [Vibrio cholerae]CSD38581.1 Uncharacterised protein [Vibrio cholerae]CSI35708.1 Uncharacterised protein [Vibrio cholerae]